MFVLRDLAGLQMFLWNVIIIAAWHVAVFLACVKIHTSFFDAAKPRYLPKHCLLYTSTAKDEEAWFDGKEKPFGGGINRATLGSSIKGRGRAMIGLRTNSPSRKVKANARSNLPPHRRCFLFNNNMKMRSNQIKPFSPSIVMMGKTISVTAVCRFCCTKFMIT